MGSLSEWEKEIPAPRFIRGPYGRIRDAAGRLFRNPAFILATLAAVLLAAFLLRLDAAQRLALALGSLAKGSPLNGEVWHGRFESWGISLVTNPFFIFFLLHAARTLLCPECRRKSFDTVFLGISYLVWLSFAGYTALRHEPWMDELFVYIKARDMSLGGLLADVKVDGNFALWSILVSLFAKSGCPAGILTVISFLLCAALVLVFLLRSPFTVYEKAAFIFTAAASYHYPVVSRPYVLFALLAFLLASLWKRRREHPLLAGAIIALLANTHLYAEGFVGILILYVLLADIILPWKALGGRERRLRLAGLAVAFAGVIVAAILVVPALWTSRGVVMAQAGRMNLNMKAFFSNWIWEDPSVSGLPVILILLALLVRLFFLDRGMLVIFGTAFSYMILFHIFIYNASVACRGSMWLFILIFAFWNAGGGQVRRTSPLLLLLLLLAVNPSWNLRDWTTEYSGEKRLGEFIAGNLPREETLYMSGPSFVSAYVPDHRTELFAPLFMESGELDRRIDKLFRDTGAASLVIVMPKIRIAGFVYPVSHRFDKLYESGEIMAQMYQFSVIRVYR